MSGNDLQAPSNSPYVIETTVAMDAGWSFAGGRYDTSKAASAWFDNNGTDQTLAQWASASSDNGTAAEVSYTDSSRTLLTYATSLGDGSLDAFMQKALANNQADGWDWSYTSYAVVDYVRVGFDKPTIGGGNVSSQYTAFRDGSASRSASNTFLLLGP